MRLRRLRVIANTRALFVSRRDRSGTDVLEHRLRREAGIDPSKGSWHRDIGCAALFSSRAVIVKKASFKSSQNAFRLRSVRSGSEVSRAECKRFLRPSRLYQPGVLSGST